MRKSKLNSKVVLFYFKLGSVIWGKDGIKWFGSFFDNIPVPRVENETISIVEKKVNEILTLKKANPSADITALEQEIDHKVYVLYGLSEEEIKIVEES